MYRILFSILFAGLLFQTGYPPAIAQDLKPFTPDEMLEVENINITGITDDGRFAAVSASTQRDRLGVDHFRFADPTYLQQRTSRLYVLDTENGEQHEVTDRPEVIQNTAWSPDNRTLAIVMMDGQQVTLHLYDAGRQRLRELRPRTGLEIASNTGLDWTPDGSGLILSLRADGWRAKADSMYTAINDGPIVIQDSNNDFLAWDRVWNQNSTSLLTFLDIDSREVTELTDEGMFDSLNIAEDGSFAAITQEFPLRTDYTRSDDATEYLMYTVSLNNPAQRDTLVSRTTDSPDAEWDPAGTRWAWSDEGKVFIRHIADTAGIEITADRYEFVEEEDTTSLEFRFDRWSQSGESVLLRSDKGYHLAGTDTAETDMELIYRFPEDEDSEPRRNLMHWSENEGHLYFTTSARDEWQRGMVRYNIDTQEMETLLVDDQLYSDWNFAEDADLLVFERAEGNHPTEVFASSYDLSDLRRLTAFSDWLDEYAIPETELIQYMDVDADTLYGVLYYPANYEEGEKYPLIAYIYENFFDNNFNALANVLANRGYFVLRPSVDLEQGYPGEGWVKGVTTAINKLMERGLVDGTKLGVEGISYGGYGANLLITQTDRFAAAINNSGKVNMISFLGDSPKIGTRNYSAAEVGQDRIGQTFWEAPDKYVAHSAVFFADRITTPLLILSGEGDWNVPADNQREMYYALRRLDKPVKWINYMNAGHGAGLAGTEEDFYHQWETVFEWYEEHFETDEQTN
ncbi:prolyl oligopeptidase family serine peptidase [Rhodohalobacter mucosus]|nr:prolyl oligopeptidase family serine peptidase [Rhodohalobacter mucosus]